MDLRFVLYFIVPIVMAFGITLIGAVLLLIDWRKKTNQVETGDWLVAGGKVTAVQPDSVQYSYTAGSAEFTGTTPLPAGTSPNMYSANMYVPVRYNPKNPTDSMLDNLPRSANYMNFFGWLFAAFGILACCFTGFMAIIILGSVQ
jgi:hypothetical protein